MLITEKELSIALAKATEKTYLDFKSQFPDETFFSFALYTTDHPTMICACANSIQSHQKRLDHYNSSSNTSRDEYLRWTPSEWAHIDSSHLKEVYPIMNAMEEQLGFYRYCDTVIQAMQNALKILDEKFFFGKGDERDNITLFITIIDSKKTESVEERSSKYLNPKKVHNQFLNRYEISIYEEENKEVIKEVIKNSIANLSITNQILYWLNEYDKIANSKKSVITDKGFDEYLLLDFLTSFGKNATLPILNYIDTVLEKEETPFDTFRFHLLKIVKNSKDNDKTVHNTLVKLLAKSCAIASSKKSWQTTPFHIANCLFNLFDNYPEPNMLDNNALESYEEFLNINIQS
ncbi:DUF4303 domain-containing protein [Tenacibaculum larymnensis]|uniref:DUF4303 domain-containing protein n=1 Tax=Tenacibaculum larymnensis TaxID=2878201 RepID=A0A9X4ENP5_9FLAO|nr:DUF4303 domain-containing protein [Tenacibaculum larymnensis]MDE1207426.1 DUF4303 domain-containing protein [Tenacibaculum larymnensis]